MLGWLFSRPLDIDNESTACILEECGPTFIDKEYRRLGESEGWLIMTGYYIDSNGGMVFTYKYAG